MSGNKKIKNFLILGFLGNLILIVLITLISYIGISKINTNYDDYHKHEKLVIQHMESVKLLYSIDIKLNTIHKFSKQHLLSKNKDEMFKIKSKIAALKDEIYQQAFEYSNLEKKLNSQTNFYENFKYLFSEFIKIHKNIIGFSESYQKNKAIQLGLTESTTIFSKTEALIEDIIRINVNKSISEQAVSLKFYQDSKNVISSTISYILILGVLCAWASILLALTTIYLITDTFNNITSKEKMLQEQNLILKSLLEKEQILRHINVSIRQSLNLDEVLKSIIDETAKFLEADICFVLEYDKQNDILKPFSYQYFSNQSENSTNQYFLTQICTLTDKLKELKEIEYIENICDYFKDSKIQYKICDLSAKAVLFVPIIYQNSLSSIIGLIRKNNQSWSKDEISSIQLITDQFAIVLEQSILFEKLKNLNTILLSKEQELKERNMSLIKIMEDLEYANRELIIINKSLRELDEMKTNFIATVSHELRTPLTSIKGSLGLILNGMAGEYSTEIGDFLHVCYRNTDRLVRLINELLDIAKIESGRIAMNKIDFDLLDLINESIEDISSFAKEKNVRLVNNIAVHTSIYADHDRIGQVIYNLLSNAIKFTSIVEDREGCIELETFMHNDDTAICVKDNGIGIPNDMQSIIFDKFTQVDNSSTRNINGTGLGLAISKAIVEEHEGKIWVESIENEGTKVIFTIACKEKQIDADKLKNKILLIDETSDFNG